MNSNDYEFDETYRAYAGEKIRDRNSQQLFSLTDSSNDEDGWEFGVNVKFQRHHTSPQQQMFVTRGERLSTAGEPRRMQLPTLHIKERVSALVGYFGEHSLPKEINYALAILMGILSIAVWPLWLVALCVVGIIGCYKDAIRYHHVGFEIGFGTACALFAIGSLIGEWYWAFGGIPSIVPILTLDILTTTFGLVAFTLTFFFGWKLKTTMNSGSTTK